MTVAEGLRRGFRLPGHAGDPGRDGAELPPAIVFDGAGRLFGSTVALEDVSLRVAFGTILGVIGPSGAGKTTTIRLITGGLEPTHGTVRVLGENPRHFKRRTRERIGYMPQLFVLYPDLTVEENVSFAASLFGMLWRRRSKSVREVLGLVDLWDVRDRRASQLSGGMQRRLELACALVHDPRLIILDEPTAGLDPILRRAVWDELHRRCAAGRTLVVTTQYVGEAEECHQVALVDEGRLIALDAPEAMRRRALGGDVLEIETKGFFDASALRSLPAVRSVRQTGPRQMRVIADDAGAATPAIVEAIGSAGDEVVSSREYRPSFDEVFTALVTQQRERSAAGPASADDVVGSRSTDPPVPQAASEVPPRTASMSGPAIGPATIAHAADGRADVLTAAPDDDRLAIAALVRESDQGPTATPDLAPSTEGRDGPR